MTTPDHRHPVRSSNPSTRTRLRSWRALLLLGTVAALAAPGPRISAALTSDVIATADFQSPALPAGWSVDRPGVWSVRHGRLRTRLPEAKQEKSFAYFGHSRWTDYRVDVDVCGLRGVDKGIAVRAQGEDGIGVDLRGDGYHDVVMYRGYSRLGKAPVRNPNRRWHHLRIVVRGDRYQVFVNGRLRIDYRDDRNHRPAGGVALAAYTGAAGACDVLYDNVIVHELR